MTFSRTKVFVCTIVPFYLGFSISIPYFILYSYFISIFSITHYSLPMLNCSIIFLSSLISYLLFATNILLGIQIHRSYLNYLAFVGLVVSTFNVRLILSQQEHQQIVDLLTTQFVHIYQYITHLLSVKFELNPESHEPR